VKLGDKKVYGLAYADDIVLLAKDEKYDREEYIERKGSELNREKIKIMRFRKRGDKSNKVEMKG